MLIDLKLQVDTFFAVILTSLIVRAVVQGVVFALWLANAWQWYTFDYRDSWRFLIWWVYVDATAEGLLNFFLVYHLFKNQSEAREGPGQPKKVEERAPEPMVREYEVENMKHVIEQDSKQAERIKWAERRLMSIAEVTEPELTVFHSNCNDYEGHDESILEELILGKDGKADMSFEAPALQERRK